MQDISNNLSYSDATAKLREYQDYKDILEEFGLSYTDQDHYWQVGEIEAVQGWILHLSSIRMEVADLFRLVIPELINDDVPFRILKDNELVKMAALGNLGIERLGKMMAVYPKEHTDIVLLAHKLITLTSGMKGPAIPTDRHLGSVVYTRYGSYKGLRNKDNSADTRKYIYGPGGDLVVDEYYTPFVMPDHLSWPFMAITDPLPKPLPKLWNNRYKPLFLLKQNVKGMVVRGIYMKSFLNVKSCIIKEGKMGMWEDEWGRDIQDRLKWQYDLCKDLSNDIPFPKIFDLFKMGEDMYLAMEFVKGKSLEDIVIEKYQGNSWSELPKADKLLLCQYLISIIEIIKKLHERGYVHRDITGHNFLIDKKGKIKLIDVELAYSIKDQRPMPAFKYGSEGFVSPQQHNHEIPTIEEDIFAIGGLMSFVFTGTHPNKYNKLKNEYSRAQFLALNDDEGLGDVVAQASLFDSTLRPGTDTILNELNRFYNKIKSQKEFKKIQVTKLKDEEIAELINNGIGMLSTPKYAEPDAKWHSPMVIVDNGLGVPQYSRTYISAIYNGMTGVAYWTTFANAIGYDTSSINAPYENTFAFLIKRHITNQKEIAAGLYEGWAGIALTFLEAMRAGLIPPDEANIGIVNRAFEKVSDYLDLGAGVAGQGVALLQCTDVLGEEAVKPLLDHYVNILLDAQQSDGAWFGTPGSPYEKMKHPGLAVGAGGIVIFLLAFNARFPEERVGVAIKKALNWMISQAKKEKDIYTWKLSKEQNLTDRYSRDIGIPGVALAFIYAYVHLKDPIYKEVATGTLLGINAQPCLVDFSLSVGLAGLGDVYIEAKNAFGDEIWQERADWIANFFKHTQIELGEGYKYWIPGINSDSPTELMTGFSGILYFLLKYQHPDMFNNLLLP